MAGTLKIYTGCVRSGKTNSLIQEAQIFINEFEKESCIAFNHSFDYWSRENKIRSHDGNEIEAISASSAGNIIQIVERKRKRTGNVNGIFINEIQFFEPDICGLIEKYLVDEENEYYIVAAGLDLNSYGYAFGYMPYLLSIADDVIKLKARCSFCGDWSANRSQRVVNSTEEIIPDSQAFKTHEPRCLLHFNPTKVEPLNAKPLKVKPMV